MAKRKVKSDQPTKRFLARVQATPVFPAGREIGVTLTRRDLLVLFPEHTGAGCSDKDLCNFWSCGRCAALCGNTFKTEVHLGAGRV